MPGFADEEGLLITGMALPAVAAALLLAGCAKPRIEFRGFTELSSCRQTIDAELAGGSVFEDVYDSEDPESTDVITELSGEIFETEVQIAIACSPRNELSYVNYIALAEEPAETGQVYARFAAELAALFGAPTEVNGLTDRRMHFLCDEPSPVLVEEYLVEDEVHEVYLAFIPGNAGCLPERR